MSTRLIILLIFALKTNSQCTKGTLKCDFNRNPPKPQICDFKNGYLLDPEKLTCLKTEVEGCKTPSFNRKASLCFKCQPGKVYDAETSNCVDVLPKNQIENCLDYSTQTLLCESCKEHHWMSENVCKKVPEDQRIGNCSSYSSATDCSTCKSGYQLIKNKCQEFTPILGCKFHTDFECLECTAGYLPKADYSPPVEVADLMKKEIILDKLSDAWISSTTLKTPVCYQQKVPNCQVYETFQSCKTCKDGHYLDSKKTCVQNPEAKFANCLRYADKQKCNHCGGPFYLNLDESKCLKATAIENCEVYKRKLDRCLRCKQDFWLDEQNSQCVSRTLTSVDFCIGLSDHADGCLGCESGLSLTLDSLKCLPDFKNCMNQQPASDRYAKKHTCLSCREHFYMLNESCQLQNVENCLQHQHNQNLCKTCKATFYLDSGTCKPQDIQNCALHTPNENKCGRCIGDRYIQSGACISTHNPNCQTFNANSNDCLICDPGFFLSGTSCQKNRTPNCQIYKTNLDGCDTCLHGYLKENNQCLDKSIDHCSDYVFSTHTCNGCSVGYYLKLNACHRLSVPNCLEYLPNSNDCAKCSAGRYRENNQCKLPAVVSCIKYEADNQTCKTCSKGLVLKNGVCISNLTTNCLELDAALEVCTLCARGFWLEDDSGVKSCTQQSVPNCTQYTSNSPECSLCAQGFWLESVSNCTPFSTLIDQCIEFSSANGDCTKCALGFWLEGKACVEFSLDNCIEFDPETRGCEQCAAGYALADDKLACHKLNTDNCVNYQTNSTTCQDCAKGYHFFGDKCVKLDVQSCISYETNGSCKTCQKGTYLKDGNCLFPDVENCIQYETQSNNCSLCAKGHFLQDSGTCLVQNLSNCIEYNKNAGSCKTCAFGYLNKSTFCEPFNTSTCLQLNASGDCIECPQDKYLQGTSCLQRNKSHCVEYAGTTNDCKTCQDGFFVETDDSTCARQSIQNCIDYTPNTNICIKCRAGSYKSGNTCLDDRVEHCILSNASTCDTCSQAFYKVDDTTCSPVNKSNCVEYDANSNTCATCAQGSRVDGTSCTVNSVPNCIEHSASGTCTHCAKHYFKVSGTSCQIMNIANCAEHTSDTVCSSCVKGFYWDGAQCAAYDIDHCVQFNNSERKCIKCSKDRTLTSADTVCSLISVSNCVAYQPDTRRCVTCGANTYINGDGSQCVAQEKANCIEFDSNTNDCKACGLGHYSSGGDCVPQAQPKCLTYHFNMNKCKSCAINYYPDSSDGSCQPQTNITNCRDYTRNSATCETCQLGYYLKSGAECAAQNLTGCIDYNINSNICIECEIYYYLKDGVCTSFSPISNCKTYASDSPACDECLYGFYFDDEKTACAKVTISNCKVQTPNKNACTTCELNFKIDKDDCVSTAIENCLTVDKTTNLCVACAEKYYSDDKGVTCKTPIGSVSGCETFSDDIAATSCVKCESLKYLKGKKCESITDPTNCVTSDGLTDACAVCKGDFFLKDDGSGNKTCTARNLANRTPNCNVHLVESDEKACTTCDTGYSGVDAPKRTVTAIPNCYKMNPDTEKCILCDEKYVLLAAGTCQGPIVLTEAQGCIRKVESNTSDLSTNTNCNDCDPDKQYKYVMKSNVCTVRRFIFSFDQNCETWDSETDICTKCTNAGFYMKEYPKYHVALGAGITMAVEHCILVDTDDKCVRCKPGMTLTSDKTICRNYSQDEVRTVPRSFTYNFDNKAPITFTEEMVINCTAYSQIDADRIGCTKCKAGYTGIVSKPGEIGTKLYAYATSANNNYNFDDVVNVYTKCESEGEVYLKSTLIPITDYGTCAVGFKFDTDKAGFACLKCRPGYMGKIGKATHYSDVEAIGKDVTTIVDCRLLDTLEMTKVHRGFFFNNYKTEGPHLLRSSYLYYDSCPSPKLPVYMIITSLDNLYISFPTVEQADTKPLDHMYCIDSSYFTPLTGCQIYGLAADLITNLNTTFVAADANSSLIKCIVCKPGFSVSSDGQSCEDKTSHCSIQASDWLGGCSTPAQAFSYTNSEPFGISEASEINASNCKVQSSEGDKECWMCKEGYHWVIWAKQCRPAFETDKCTARIGGGYNQTTVFNGTDDKKMNAFANMIWHRWESSVAAIYQENFGFEHCYKNQEGNYFKEGDSQYFCTATTNPLANCSVMKLEPELKNCNICDTGYVALPKDSGEFNCVANGDFANCHRGKAGGCELCFDGYFKVANADKACVLKQCKMVDPHDTAKCLICDDGKYLVPGNKLGCVDQEAPSPGDCLNFSPVNQTCVKCRDSTKKPFVGFTVNDLTAKTPVYTKVLDFKCRVDDTSADYYSEYNYEFMFYKVSKNLKDHTFSTHIQIMETPTLYTRLGHKGVPKEDRINTLCVAHTTTSVVSGCSTFGIMFCQSCNASFFLADANECTAYEVPAHDRCSVVTKVGTDAKCTECFGGSFLSAGVCTARTINSNSKTCLTPVEDKDECELCHEGYYLDGTKKTCQEFTATNCKTKSNSENKCLTCVARSFVDSEDKCKLYTLISDCATYEEAEDKCKTCSPAFTLSENACTRSTAEKCKTFTENADSCATCTPNYYKSDSNCALKNKPLCLTYEPDSNACATCTNLYKKVDTTGCSLKLDTLCDAPVDNSASADSSVCSRCSTNHTPNEIRTGVYSCSPKNATQCKTYDPVENKCASCSDSFVLNADFSCTPKPPALCKTFDQSNVLADQAKCDTCFEKGFAKSGSSCVSLTNENCLTRNDTDYTCASCSNEFNFSYPNCNSKTSVNCLKYADDQDACETCGPLFYLSGTDCAPVSGSDCKTYNYTNGKCATCETGFVLNSSENCEQNQATNCRTFNPTQHKCASCYPMFKWDLAETNCIMKTAKNCVSYVDDPGKDECSTCQADFVKDPTSGHCQLNSGTDCNAFVNDKHACAKCSRLYFLNPKTKSCKLREALNCETYSTEVSKDQCTSCKLGFVKNPSTHWCDMNSASSCRSFEAETHQCASCSELFLKTSEGVCESNIASNCLTLKTTAFGCNSCFAENFTKTGDTCVRKDAKNCKNYSTSANECSDCDPNFYKQIDNSCAKRVAQNCKTFTNTADDECDTCESGYYKATGKCVKNTGTNCLAYNTNTDGCLSCGSLHYKDGLNCLPNNSELCKSFKFDENKCEDCGTLFEKSSPGTSCTKFQTNNCLTINSSLKNCASCSDHFVFSGGACTRNTGQNCKTFDKNTAGCVDCHSGFYKNSSDCVPIDKSNCNSWKENVNECKTCATNWVLHATDKDCQQNSALNCLDFEFNSNSCLSCSENFYKNSNNCSMKSADNCKSFQTGSATNKCQECGDLSVQNSTSFECSRNTALNCQDYITSDHKCQNCSSGFYKNGSGNCVEVTVKFCLELETNKNECKKCARNWVLNAGSKTCEPNRANNCLTFKLNVDQCDTCKRGFWMDASNNNLCTPYSAENCISFKTDKNECLNCQDNYYLTNEGGVDSCIKNTAGSCEVRSKSENKCTACLAGFYLDAAQNNECVHSSAQNCETYARNKNECASCLNWFLEITEENVLHCREYTAQNCQTFKKGQDSCLSCKQGHFIKADPTTGLIKCVERLVTSCVDFLEEADGCQKCPDTHHINVSKSCTELSKVKHCVKYALDENTCLECDLGFYKSPTDNECLPNPSGIANCAAYLNEHECWKCDSTTYFDLSLNQCLPVLTTIDQCLTYLNATTCHECNPDFHPSDQGCLPISALNCEILIDHQTCQKCFDNHVLDPSTSKCVPSNIHNCKQALRFDSKVICSLCMPGFLLSDDLVSCSQPEKLIEFCLEYKDQEECKQCNQGYVLAKDRKSCFSNPIMAHTNCARGQELSELTCDKCHYGFRKNDEGKCTLLLPVKCAVVDPKTERCLLCAPGTYMNAKEECKGTPSDIQLIIDLIPEGIGLLGGFKLSILLVVLSGLLPKEY